MPATIESLCDLLNRSIARGPVGMAIALRDGEGTTAEAARGLADIERRLPLTPAHRFRIASITKTFVFATLLQLHQECAVDIDAPLGHWLPDLPFADRVSLRQVLTQTGGLPTYAHDVLEDFPPADSSWTPAALIARAYAMTPPVAPGGPMEYANVGSKVIATVIERVTGRPVGDQIVRRLLAPLGLDRIVSTGAFGPPPDDLARGYYFATEDDAPIDATTRVPPSFIWASGDMYATVGNLTAWGQALFTGRVLNAELTAALLSEMVPGGFPGSTMSHHGLGVMIFSKGGHRVFGHRGSTPGYAGIMGYAPDLGVTVAVQSNSHSPDHHSVFRAEVEHALFAALDLVEPRP
jgi:D-alanyl-D-alanine carboxypeptidase